MGIHSILVINNHGQARLVKFFKEIVTSHEHTQDFTDIPKETYTCHVMTSAAPWSNNSSDDQDWWWTIDHKLLHHNNSGRNTNTDIDTDTDTDKLSDWSNRNHYRHIYVPYNPVQYSHPSNAHVLPLPVVLLVPHVLVVHIIIIIVSMIDSHVWWVDVSVDETSICHVSLWWWWCRVYVDLVYGIYWTQLSRLPMAIKSSCILP